MDITFAKRQLAEPFMQACTSRSHQQRNTTLSESNREIRQEMQIEIVWPSSVAQNNIPRAKERDKKIRRSREDLAIS